MFGGGSPGLLVMMVLLAIVYIYFIVRPQQKKEKAIKSFRDGLKKGDEVITRGGIFGKVLDVKDDKVLVEVSTAAKITVEKSALSAVVPAKA